MQIVYFDYNSTTAVAPEVLAKMNEAYALPLNSSATHQLGRKGYKMVEDARIEVKKLLNAQNYDVIFTSCSTEATNMVLCGTDAEVILFSEIEHSSVYNCRPEGKKIIELKVLENGLVDLNYLAKKLDEINTPNFLVSVMLANNESGAIQPVTEIAKLVHQKGGLFHCDIVQAVGKIDVDLEKINADFASISAHKLAGPQGVGALLVRKGLDVKPLIHGGKQERSKRAGTSNVAGIVGFGEACKLARARVKDYDTKVRNLRDFLESEMKKIAGENVMIFCENAPRLPNTSYVATKGCDHQTLLINFDLNGICVSAGAACSSGTTATSRVLKAMNAPTDFAVSTIRVSLCPSNTREEAEKFLKVWSEFLNRNK